MSEVNVLSYAERWGVIEWKKEASGTLIIFFFFICLNIHFFSYNSETRNPISRCQQFACLLGPLFLACWWLSPPCVHIVLPCVSMCPNLLFFFFLLVTYSVLLTKELFIWMCSCCANSNYTLRICVLCWVLCPHKV